MADDLLWEDQASIFRPSYSATWLSCSGSLLPSQQVADSADIDAAVGTVFHLLMAEWQTSGKPESWLGLKVPVQNQVGETFDITVDEEMFVYGQDCIDYANRFQGDRFIEVKVDISDLTPIPNQTGTADLIVCKARELDVIDWKYGRGVQVFAEENTQLLLYAWGAFQQYDYVYDFQTIRMHIAQPRLRHWDDWEVGRDELIAWASWAKERASAAWKRGADRAPSPKACQWCKVRVDCVALEAARQDLADMTFEAIDEPVTESRMQEIVKQPAEMIGLVKPVHLPTEQLAKILRFRKLMDSWFKEIAEELTTRALHGEQVEGWKITEGRTLRRIRDEQLAVEKLSPFLDIDQIYERKIASPKKIETMLNAMGIRGRLLSQFMRIIVYKPQGKPTLAPDGDNRLALPNIVDESFDEDEAAL